MIHILTRAGILMAIVSSSVAVAGTQLFLDDHLVASRTGTTRRSHACRKLTAPVLKAERPWEQAENDRRVYIYGTVLREPGTSGLRMWYNRLTSVLCATSEGGIRWERPRLGLREYQGSRDNNMVQVRFHSPSLIRDDRDPDLAKRYKMLGYVGKKGYCAAYSSDGLSWHEYAGNPVLAGGDTCTLAQDPATGEYLAFHKLNRNLRGHNRRLVFLAASRDMETWSKPVLVMAPDEIDDAQTRAEGGICSQFYNMSAFSYAGQWLGMVTHFRFSRRLNQTLPGQSPDDGPIDVQLVHSRDSRTWHRCENRTPVIPNGPHDYDAGCILGVANQPVTAGDSVWLYYTAITTTHGGAMPEKQISIARAEWRRDGFVSLDAGEQEGTVEMAPLRFAADRLHVNADASGGELVVEVLDASGKGIPGYGRKDCIPIRSDSVRHAVRWQKHAVLPSGTSPIRLRFHLRKTSLFSYGVTPAGTSSARARPAKP